MSLILSLVLSFAPTAFAEDAVAQPATIKVAFTDLPCIMPVQEGIIVNINAIKPGLFGGNRRFMMDRAIALSEMQARASVLCTTALGDAVAKIDIGQATADQIRTGNPVRTTVSANGKLSTATGAAATQYGYGDGYGGNDVVYTTRGRLADADDLLTPKARVPSQKELDAAEAERRAGI